MSANRFGEHFQITSFGESHGLALGAVIEGCPAGVNFNESLLKSWLERRRPGLAGRETAIVSSRGEPDQPEILSGVFENKTLGTPIAIVVRNQDSRPQDYEEIRLSPRAGHADDVWREKFGHSDYRGGGRSSGRETLARVIGGAVAQMFLQTSSPEMKIWARPRQIGPIEIHDEDVDFSANIYHVKKSKWIEIENYLLALKTEGDSVGGTIEIAIEAPPKSLGQPVFHKLKSDLASAFFGIGATAGVELGDGFSLATARGTQVHTHSPVEGSASPYGGIRGGISTGETIKMRIAFKPTSSILDVAKRGRHDPCIVLRALPVVEAMAYLVIADHTLWRRLDQ